MARKGKLGVEGELVGAGSTDKQGSLNRWSRQDAQAVLDNYDIESACDRVAMESDSKRNAA